MSHQRHSSLLIATLLFATVAGIAKAPPAEKPTGGPYDMHPKPIASDPAVKYDYDIVYVRAPRHGDERNTTWPEVFAPLRAEPGSDLVLLHPDGSEEVLVAAGDDAVTDPFVSFDGQAVYYALIHNVRRPGSDKFVSPSSDIFRIHVKSRKIVQLTHQEFTPNTGVVAADAVRPGVHNLGPCPLPGGRVMFTSTRNGFVPTKDYTNFAVYKDEYPAPTTLQLFVMDENGGNVETIGNLNINTALHPTILKDGRVMFTSFETQGLRDVRPWAIWTINPDGTNWAPLVSALGASGETARHFMTQLSDGNIVWEHYYFQRNMGFGTFFKIAPSVPQGEPYFGSASLHDTRNLEMGRFTRMPFTPHGLQEITPFSSFFNAPAYPSNPKDPKSPAMGKVTHPSGAPDNHLLAVWSAGPVYGIADKKLDAGHEFVGPAADSGIYLIKNGDVVSEPGKLLLIKNDPRYNEQWPRALVPYKRIYGVEEPARIPAVRNDGKRAAQLPEGTPFGMVGTSSLYKRESYPHGSVPPGQVTAQYSGSSEELGAGAAEPALVDPYEGLNSLMYNPGGNWFEQGADDGKYKNSDIHAIRILITEPTTDPRLTRAGKRTWWNAADERLRILGEFPVRKFQGREQPLDPDGNPDTSFLVKIPANVAWTFQTLDKNGMVLNMAQTWHQLRPGEVRNNCGGCHAHSQKPTRFEETAAAKPGYEPFDLTHYTSLLTTKKDDESHKKWDVNDETGLRYQAGVKTVEFFRDVKPILDRSCVACHTQRWEKPAGNLVLDDERPEPPKLGLMYMFLGSAVPEKVPNNYVRLALDQTAKYGYPLAALSFRRRPTSWEHPQASRYVRYFQSRRSLLVWKIYGRRMDGFKDEDFAYETRPGDPSSLQYKGEPFQVDATDYPGGRHMLSLAFTGTAMPPSDAVAGTYRAPNGETIKVPPLSDEDRLTIVRWIDLGCPIDLDFDPKDRAARHGWLADDNRPTLTVTYPQPGVNAALTRIVVGMHDYDSGIDTSSFHVTADFPVNGVAPGQELAAQFKAQSPGVWALKLTQPIARLAHGTLTVSVKDHAGNTNAIERAFSVHTTVTRSTRAD